MRNYAAYHSETKHQINGADHYRASLYWRDVRRDANAWRVAARKACDAYAMARDAIGVVDADQFFA